MPSLYMQRDLASVQNTFSSWDSCMSRNYCKWPAIVGIIIGVLIAVSIIWCCARCLCCGAECCCACCSCFNRCCPSPRNKNQGYQQQPPQQPYAFGNQHHYQSHAPPTYGGAGAYTGGGAGAYGAGALPATGYGGYRSAQTAKFDVSSQKEGTNHNEDSLPAMPSWENAQSRRELVEDDEVELKRMDQQTAQSQPFLAGGVRQEQHHEQHSTGRYYNAQDSSPAGDLGTMQANPYHDYDQHQQFVSSPASTMAPQSDYPPTYRAYASPTSTEYEPNYAPGVPPSYHTAAPTSPPPGLVPGGGIGRKPLQGSYREM